MIKCIIFLLTLFESGSYNQDQARPVGNEMFVEHESGTRSDAGLWAELLDPEEMPDASMLALEQAREPKGSPIGGQFKSKGETPMPTGAGGLIETNVRAFDGRQTGGPKLSKLEVDKLGEDIAVRFLKDKGLLDARSLNTKGNNFALDLVAGQNVYELKSGATTNSSGAQQWRVTLGQPGPTEAKALAKMSAKKKATYNEKKMVAAMDRKAQAVDTVSTALKLKRPVQASTLAVIVNPVTRTADVYQFPGFHRRIGWRSPETAKGYRGSFRY